MERRALCVLCLLAALVPAASAEVAKLKLDQSIVTVPQELVSGKGLDVGFYVTNHDAKGFDGSFTAMLLLDGSLAATESFDASIGGGETEEYFFYDVQPFGSKGWHEIEVSISESGYYRRGLFMVKEGVAQSDAVPAKLAATTVTISSGNAIEGVPCNISLTIENTGSAQVTGDLETRLFVDGLIEREDSCRVALQPGSQDECSFENFTFRSAGRHKIVAAVFYNSGGVVLNASTSAYVTIAGAAQPQTAEAPKPGLKVTSVSAEPVKAAWNGSVEVMFTVKNPVDERSSGNATATLFIDGRASNQMLLDKHIEAGDSEGYSFSVPVRTLLPGMHTAKIRLDSGYEMSEGYAQFEVEVAPSQPANESITSAGGEVVYLSDLWIWAVVLAASLAAIAYEAKKQFEARKADKGLEKLLITRGELEKELRLAKTGYLKRRIDEETYRGMAKSINERLIRLNAKIAGAKKRLGAADESAKKPGETDD